MYLAPCLYTIYIIGCYISDEKVVNDDTNTNSYYLTVIHFLLKHIIGYRVFRG